MKNITVHEGQRVFGKLTSFRVVKGWITGPCELSDRSDMRHTLAAVSEECEALLY
jgi:methionine synthase II (cobalamin-independent)